MELYRQEVERRCCTFDANEEAQRIISILAEIMTSTEGKFGLMLCGVAGNGKTSVLRALQRLVVILRDSGYIEQSRGLRVYDAKEIVMMCKDLAAYRMLQSEELLGIEDMGREPTETMSYGNVSTPIIDIIERRYEHRLFTAITTNLTAPQIRQKYGARIADRFNEMLDVIVFKGESYRGKS